MSIQQMSPLAQRLAFSSLTFAILFSVIYFSFTPGMNILAPLFAATVAGLGIREYYSIARKKGLIPRVKTGIVLAFLYIFSIFFSNFTPYQELLPLAILGITLLSVFFAYFMKGPDPFVNSAISLFGIVYIAIPLGCALQINYFFPQGSAQDGRWWLFYLISISTITDTAGLFFGKIFGRVKLAPMISPKKTWEGAIGGFFSAILVSLIFVYFASNSSHALPLHMTVCESIFLGAILSILAQIGDLSESLLKRDVGVKDSSKIPGLGGVLDVIDSLVFTSPFLYLFLRYQSLGV